MIKQYIRENWLKLISLVIVIIAMAVPRALTLDRFVTPDEPRWLTRSADFYLALSQKDFVNTYQKEHPGVTIMWAGTAGFLWRYPQYVDERAGSMHSHQRFERYLRNRGIEPIILVEAGRIFVVAGIVLALALAYWAAIKLLGLLTAFVGFLLIALDPFSIALSRLLHLDGLLSALMLLSLLAMLNYFYRGRRPTDLLLSAIAAGLGWLTKSPALFLLPFFGLLALIDFARSWRLQGRFPKTDLWPTTWPLLAWIGIATLIFVLFFPAMWVAPLQTLNKIFIETWLYASVGHKSATFFNGIVFPGEVNDWRFYPLSYLWRTTPVTLIGLGLLALAFLLRRRIDFPKEQQRPALLIGLFVILYTLFMTLGAKKFDRYLLPVFAPLDLLAALGWVAILTNAWHALRRTSPGAKYSSLTGLGAAVICGAIFAWQAWGTLQTYPYYFSYYNPLMGGPTKAPQVMMIGWGEGLDQAARYLNAKPDAENMTVASWYPDGPFSFFFQGKTLLQHDFSADPKDLPRVDYVVLYLHQWQRQRPSLKFLEYFEQREPEQVIWINDLPYAYIYRMR